MTQRPVAAGREPLAVGSRRLADGCKPPTAIRQLPALALLGIQPDVVRVIREQALHPHGARFLVPVLDAAAGLDDLVRAHGGVADHDQLVVVAVGAHDFRQRRAFRVPAPVVLPHGFIDEIVEVEVLEVLELAARGGEEFLADAHVVVHRAADVEEQQDFHGIVPLGDHADVEQPRAPRGRIDRRIEVELQVGALARKTPQPPQRQLDVARAEQDGVVEVRELAPVPDLDRAPVARALLADAHAFRVVAVGAERRGAAGADPLAAALVAPLLLLQAPAQGLHQRVPAPERLDLRLLLVGELQSQAPAQPVGGDLGGEQRLDGLFGALEVRGERAVETVVVALVLDQHGAREPVELVHRQADQPRLERLEQRQELGNGHRHAGGAQHQEEADQHGPAARFSRACQRGDSGTRAARTGARPARSSAAPRRAAGSRPCRRRLEAPPPGCPRPAAA